VDSSPAVLVHRYNITQKKRAEVLFTEQKDALEQYVAALCTASSHSYHLLFKLHQLASHVHFHGNVHVHGSSFWFTTAVWTALMQTFMKACLDNVSVCCT